MDMSEPANIIIRDTLEGLGTDAYGNYLAHALCLAGSCSLKYNGQERELQAGDLMIVRKGKLVEHIRPAVTPCQYDQHHKCHPCDDEGRQAFQPYVSPVKGVTVYSSGEVCKQVVPPAVYGSEEI